MTQRNALRLAFAGHGRAVGLESFEENAEAAERTISQLRGVFGSSGAD